MKVQITARHYQASRQLHQNLVEHAESLSRFNDAITGVHFVLDAGQAGGARAEGVARIHEKSVVASAEEGSMGKSIETMLERLERQLKKENEKLKVHQGEPLATVAAPATA